MSLYDAARGALFLLPAEPAHHLGLASLELLSAAPGLCATLRRASASDALAIDVAGLHFPSCIGLAAGLDKNAQAVAGLFALGFGAVEVGTVTPRPQPGNPSPRLFRIPAHKAVINRMGFNNDGAQAMATRLRELSYRPGPVGVNLGKNKDTPLADATADYLACLEALGDLGDYFVVNASSPNTPGLRSLQEPEALASLLTAVRTKLRRDRPLFLKIAPDLALEAVDAIVDVALSTGIEGIIATNTTLERPFEDPVAKQAGGLSGAPLRQRSTEIIRRAFVRAQRRLSIIGVGGVFTAEDAYEKVRAGASLVQVYTGFIYEGPGMVQRLHRGLAGLLARDGFAHVSDAVGVTS